MRQIRSGCIRFMATSMNGHRIAGISDTLRTHRRTVVRGSRAIVRSISFAAGGGTRRHRHYDRAIATASLVRAPVAATASA